MMPLNMCPGAETFAPDGECDVVRGTASEEPPNPMEAFARTSSLAA